MAVKCGMYRFVGIYSDAAYYILTCGIKLDRAFLRYAEKQEANLEGSQMTFADFIAANMRKARLNGANMEGAKFMHTKLERCQFE